MFTSTDREGMTHSSPRASLREFRPVALDSLVRVGNDGDGGYVLPLVALQRSSTLLSLGVLDDWSFEAGALRLNPALRVVCVDGTATVGRVVKKAAQKLVDMVGQLLTFRWEKLRRNAAYLSRPLGFRKFFREHELLPLMLAARSGDGQISLPDLLARVHPADGRNENGWLLLKIDIEGAEFEILPMPLGWAQRTAALLIEFHDLDRNWDRFTAVMRTLQESFYVAHLHGNNFEGFIPGTDVPTALEVSLINKLLVPGTPPLSQRDYPLPALDRPNNWKRADLPLGFG